MFQNVPGRHGQRRADQYFVRGLRVHVCVPRGRGHVSPGECYLPAHVSRVTYQRTCHVLLTPVAARAPPPPRQARRHQRRLHRRPRDRLRPGHGGGEVDSN